MFKKTAITLAALLGLAVAAPAAQAGTTLVISSGGGWYAPRYYAPVRNVPPPYARHYYAPYYYGHRPYMNSYYHGPRHGHSDRRW